MKIRNPKAWGTPKNYFNDVVTVLKEELKVNIITELYKGSTCLLEIKGHTYYLIDNGGEFTLSLINCNKSYNIPYAISYGINHPIHIVNMMKQMLEGEKVNYNPILSKEDMDYMLEVYKKIA